LAAKAGLNVGRGVVVDDEMRTSTPGVWAVGECAEHRGVVPGLWSPVLRQARVAAASLAGTPIPFEAAPMQATLKVAEIELFVVGRTSSGSADVEFIRSDAHNGDYTKLVLNDERLVGATLLGDTTRAGQLGSLVATGERVPPDVLNPRAAGVPDGDLVCSCMQVTRERIRRALEDDAADDLETVSEITGATTGCGSCAGAVTRIVTAHRRLAAVD
jgi:ferredoxin-nitrate reductase